MRWLIGVAALGLVLARVGPAAACSCNLVDEKLGGGARTLPREATLFVWTIPTYYEAPLEPKITLDGAPVSFDDELVFEKKRYGLHRLRVHAPTTGKLTIANVGYFVDPFEFEVVDDRAPASTLPLTGTLLQGLPTPWCGDAGWWVSFEGEAPAAFRVRGTLEAQPVDAYVPPTDVIDAEGHYRPSQHALPLTLGYCTEWWLDPDARLDSRKDVSITEAHWRDVEITRIDVDGTETVIARGDLDLGSQTGALPRFDAPPPLSTPKPSAPLGPAQATAWWPVGVGAGGGLAFGTIGLFALGRRRRPR